MQRCSDCALELSCDQDIGLQGKQRLERSFRSVEGELRSRTLPSTMSHGNHHESTPPVAPIICPGTVRQRDPPFFNGADDQDAEDWLATFERVSTHNNWDDKHKQNSVSLSFTGVAETWYKNHGSDLRTRSDFKTEFTKVFGRPALRKLRAEQRLRERAQRTNESFTSYIEDILDLCNRANDAMTEQGKIKHILKGIEDDAFQMLIAKNPRTVAEIINACQDFDELRRERALTRKPTGQDHSLCSLASDDKGVLFAQIQQFVREEVARQLSLVGDVVKMPQPNLAPTLKSLEATFSLNYVTIQPLKHSILWETLRLELRFVLALPPPSETPYDDRAAVLAHYGLGADCFRSAAD
ncbi:uncharacterized protein LOC144160744 [Haemaphysalis longicornis]